jgi:tetratricopeptide (TPR) repeat protein
MEFEPDILLAWARWHRAAGHAQEARECAEEALQIANRCEYRLVQADAHNLLARLALDEGDFKEAQKHATIARERAWCDGPPHCYKPALDEAEKLLAETTPPQPPSTTSAGL